MTSPGRRILVALISLVLLAAAAASQAATIYRETFGRKVQLTVNITVAAADWAVVNTSGAFPPDPTVFGSGTFAGINNDVDSKPSNVANINVGLNPEGGTAALPAGYAFISANSGRFFCFTTEYSFDTSAYQNLTFSWYEGDRDSSSMQLAVRFNGQWYIHKTAHSSPGITKEDFARLAQLKQVLLDPAASDWYALSFDGSYNFTTDQFTNSTTNLSPVQPQQAIAASGIVTGFGIYGYSVGLARFDTFQIDGTPVPEPGALGLCAAGVAIVIGRRRWGRA